MLLGIYITIPLFAKIIARARKLYVELFLLVWVLFITLSTSHTSYSNFEWNLWYYLGYLGYVVLGYYLSIINTKSKRISALAVVTFLIGLFITFYGTYYYTDRIGLFCKNYYSYLIPNVLLMATSVFVLFKNMKIIELDGFLKTVRDVVDKYSYGIYLSHILVLNYLIMFGVDWNLIHPLIGIPLTTFITLACIGDRLFF